MASLTTNQVGEIVEGFKSLDARGVTEYYDKWAESYDTDFVKGAYHGPEHVAVAAKMAMSGIKEGRILDICAGTGALGASLSEAGFKHMDALDASLGMLAKAELKAVYESYFALWLLPGQDSALAANYYDGVVSAGGFVAGHMKPDVLREFIRVTKPGGLIVFGVNDQYKEAEPTFDQVTSALTSEALWNLEKRLRIEQWLDNAPGTVYVARKM